MKKISLLAVAGYQKLLSFPIQMFFGGGCRFTPTCSDYAREAVAKFGAVRGTVLAVKRLSRCHPWGGMGFDPVPKI